MMRVPGAWQPLGLGAACKTGSCSTVVAMVVKGMMGVTDYPLSLNLSHL